jgi:hypothetical protein
MNRRRALSACLVAAVLLFTQGGVRADQSQPKKAGPVFSGDKGHFRITLAGTPVGSEQFEISSDGDAWVARGSTDLKVPNAGEMKVTGELHLAADGALLKYQWTSQSPKAANGSVTFANGTAKCSLTVGTADPYLRDFQFGDPHVVVLDNNLYYQYAVLARVYDWAAAGKQDFHVVIPQDMTPGTISVQSQANNGPLSELVVTTPDIEIHLFCDANHRLMRLEVPSSKVVVERE